MKYEKSEIDVEIKQIYPSVFVGQSKAKSGETIYLRMELITRENQPYLCQYVNASRALTMPSRSLFGYLPLHIKKSVSENGSVSYLYDGTKHTKVSRLRGFSDEEFTNFINYLGIQGFHSENARKKTILNQNNSGSNHLNLDVSGHQYFIYASKDPNFSFQSSTTVIDDNTNLTLKEYIAQYSKVLMCVGSDFSSPKRIHNRGIFRNPCNVIENTHHGIAMILHSFSGAVAKKFFEEKKTMLVKPVGFMQYIICTSLKPDEFTIENETYDNVLKESKMAVTEIGELSEFPLNSIPLEVLANFFAKSQHPSAEHSEEYKTSALPENSSSKLEEIDVSEHAGESVEKSPLQPNTNSGAQNNELPPPTLLAALGITSDFSFKNILKKYAVSELDVGSVNCMLSDRFEGSFIIHKNGNSLLFSVVVLEGSVENLRIDVTTTGQFTLPGYQFILANSLYEAIHGLIHKNISAFTHMAADDKDYPAFRLPGYKELQPVLEQQKFYTAVGNLDGDYCLIYSKPYNIVDLRPKVHELSLR